MRAGRMLPILIPTAVPAAHIGAAVRSAPKVYHGVGMPGLAIVTLKISSVIQVPTSMRVPRGVPAGILWLSAKPMSMYHRFVIAVRRISVRSVPFAA
jgi:hypothetical protein